VTGGAGYIGSAAVKELVKSYKVIVVDNLSKGDRSLVHKDADFYEVDLTDCQALEQVFFNDIDAVMHFAAHKAIGESMSNAVKYSDNILGTINLLNLMVKYKVPRIIHSSTAAVYGIPDNNPIIEGSDTKPINYYGYTKWVSENQIMWYSLVHGLSYVCLRYFNVAGDVGLGYIDPDAQNVFPILMEVISGKRDKFVIFGKDYDTPDGTCVRDYIDINDLISAHILAIDKGEGVINLGTSSGVSVKELLDTTIKITGQRIPWEYGKRRPGDCDILVASNLKAREVLDWKPQRSVKEMIESTFRAYSIAFSESPDQESQELQRLPV